MLQGRPTDFSLKNSTAEFKIPSFAAASAEADVDSHVTAINVLITELKQATNKFKETTAEIEEAIGHHIKAIKAAEPDDWERVVKAKCGLSRTRAYELMAIADGTKSAAQVRLETNIRKIRHRQNRSSVPGTDAKIIELKAAHKRELTQRDKLEAGYERQIRQFENKIFELGGADALSFERDNARAALNRIDELLLEIRGLTGHFTQNRVNIITKINRAHEIAARFKPKSTPVKQVA